jgi:hypothetical protein
MRKQTLANDKNHKFSQIIHACFSRILFRIIIGNLFRRRRSFSIWFEQCPALNVRGVSELVRVKPVGGVD